MLLLFCQRTIEILCPVLIQGLKKPTDYLMVYGTRLLVLKVTIFILLFVPNRGYDEEFYTYTHRRRTKYFFKKICRTSWGKRKIKRLQVCWAMEKRVLDNWKSDRIWCQSLLKRNMEMMGVRYSSVDLCHFYCLRMRRDQSPNFKLRFQVCSSLPGFHFVHKVIIPLCIWSLVKKKNARHNHCFLI